MSLATRTTVERAIAALIQAALPGAPSSAWLAAFPGISEFIANQDEETTAAFSATFKGDVDTDVPLTVNCMPGAIGANGEIPAEWGKLQLPAVIVACNHSEPHLIGYDICDVQVVMMTTPDEVGAPGKITARVGWAGALFDEWALDEIAQILNAAAAPVQGLSVIGLERNGEDHSENGHQVFGTLKLKVHALGIE